MKTTKSLQSQQNLDKIKYLLMKYKAQVDDNSWMYVDLMVDHIKDSDAYFRRMKNVALMPLVELEIEKIRQAMANDQRDFSSSSSEDDDEDDIIEDSRPNSNFLNRLITKKYVASTSKSGADLSAPSVEKDSGSASQNDDEKREESANNDFNTAVIESNNNSVPVTKRVLDQTKPTSSKSVTKKRKTNEYAPPSVRYKDLGGIENCIDEIRELIEAPIRHPEIYSHLNIPAPRGILLHGPPGCGKTQLARAAAGELGVPFIEISAPSLVSGMSGESEKKIRDLFNEAKELAPCLLFLDEIDVITPKRENASREMERRIVAQLLTCMDMLSDESLRLKPVIVIGATNRPDALDNALRRAGRFDREISLGIPDENARFRILQVLTQKLRLSGDFDLLSLAKLTPGYVGADLNALTTAAGVLAIKRIFGQLSDISNDDDRMDTSTSDVADSKESEIARFLQRHPNPLTEQELSPLTITMPDFAAALKKVQPSSKREGFATVPGVSWDEIGALASVREELRLSIVEPIKNPELFAKVGICNPSGVLLWGPPGCGKTLLAKAVANESHCNFISVKGPELLDKYVGESERGVRQLFARARASAPCVIFFDELDALCPKRGGSSDSSTTERVVNQLLTEMDGLEGRKNVYIIAATNRPDIIDRAVLRPGRFDKLVMVPLPTPSERFDILRTISSKSPLHESVDLNSIANDPRCERFSGADLASLVREAALSALKERLRNTTADNQGTDIKIFSHNFAEAFTKVSPSVTPKDLQDYASIQKRLNGSNAV